MVARTIPQIISVGGKQYAIGLFWQPLPGGRQQLPFIERTARSLIGGAQFYCIKTGGTGQFGLGFSKKGHRGNLPVATVSVASALKDKPSTLAVFRVKEGWWLIVVRNNLILPEDDFLFEKEDEAKKAFSDLLPLPDWGYKIAPASWQIEGTQDIELSKLLERTIRPVLLQSLAPKNILFIAALLIGLGIAGYFLKDVFFPKPIPMAKKQIETQFNSKKLAVKNEKKQEAGFLKSIQTKAVNAKEVQIKKIDSVEHARLCQSGWSYFGKIIPGWTLSEFHCTGTNMKVRYERKSGTLDFLTTAKDLYFKEATMEIQNRGGTVWLSVPLPKLKEKEIVPMLRKSEIEQHLMTFAQKTKQTINVLPGEAKIDNFDVVNFSFSSKISLVDWAMVLKDLGAIFWQEIKWSQQSKTWEVKGVVYAIH